MATLRPANRVFTGTATCVEDACTGIRFDVPDNFAEQLVVERSLLSTTSIGACPFVMDGRVIEDSLI
ncbi:MAG: hypothetical protein ACODAA_07235 [Gemmatimonadota bacterium]